MFYLKSFTVIMLLVFTLVAIATGLSQEVSLKKKDMPKAILAAFNTSYPKATIKGYAKETENGNISYEIESMEGKTHRDVSYTADGSVVSLEESIAYADVPEAIRNVVTKDYPKAKVTVCEKVTVGAVTNFELVVRSGKKKQELVFRADGTLVKQEKK